MRNNKQKITERASTSVVVIILVIASIVLFITGASMLFGWVANKENEARLNSDQMQVIQATREHYQLQPTTTDTAIYLNTDANEHKHYIVVIGERVFKVEYEYNKDTDIKTYWMKEKE